MGMATRTDDPCRRLLELTPYDRLVEWCREAGISTPKSGGASPLIEALLESRNFSFTAKGILARMSGPELGLVCSALGGMGNSRDRARLEERILGTLTPENPTPASYSPDERPPMPVDAWLEGKRSRASRAAERRHIREQLRVSIWLRATTWGVFFAAISRWGVFSHTSDALILGVGVGAVAGTIYRYSLGTLPAMVVAFGEIAARMLILGFGSASSFTLGTICFMELLCAAAMSVDADSARAAEISLGFRERRNSRIARAPSEAEEAAEPPRKAP